MGEITIYSLLLRYLNYQSGLERNRPKEIIASSEVQKGDTIADIGAGGGYFSYEFARRVGDKGKVIAVDIDQRHLKFIIQNAGKKGLSNLEVSLTDGKSLDFDDSSLDIVFMKDVFHDLIDLKSYFAEIKRVLKSNGRVVIIDFADDIVSLESRTGHCSSESTITNTMRNSGFNHVKRLTSLSKQSFNIFKYK